MEQLSLWEGQEQEAAPAPSHHYIKLVYFSGKRRLIDTANPQDDDTIRDMTVWSAEFIRKEEYDRGA